MRFQVWILIPFLLALGFNSLSGQDSNSLQDINNRGPVTPIKFLKIDGVPATIRTLRPGETELMEALKNQEKLNRRKHTFGYMDGVLVEPVSAPKAFQPNLLSLNSDAPSRRKFSLQMKQAPGIQGENVRTHQKAAAVTCPIDTLAYPSAKTSTSIRLLSVNNATSAQGLAQYYDAPQAITVYGFDFFAYAPGQATPLNIKCAIHLAGPDSMPIGPALDSAIVPVDSNFGIFTLPDLRRSATFSQGVTVTQPYVLTILNDTSANLVMITNDYARNDGQAEWLASGDFRNLGGTWTRSYNMNVGGDPFDADVLLHPYVEYSLEATLSANKTCINAGDTVCFTNFSSPVADHRMYNQHIILGTQQNIYAWNYGDGTPNDFVRDTCHRFSGSGPYTVTLSTTVLGWTGFCNDQQSVIVGGTGTPAAGFSKVQNGVTVNFTDQSSGATNWAWDFGDGNSSTMQSPTHLYPGGFNTYFPRLVVTNSCGTDTIQDTVVIACNPPASGYTYTNNFFQAIFTNTSTNADSYFWDFGDGTGTSTLANPSYAYPTYATYLCTLICSSICGNDTFVDSVVIAPPLGFSPDPDRDLSLFPNPARQQLTIRMPGLKQEFEALALVDIRGRRLLSGSGKQDQAAMMWRANEVLLDIGQLPAGLYFLHLRLRGGEVVRKVVIEK